MDSCQATNGPTLLALAAVVSLQLAQGRTADDVALMGTFFTVLGDNLALLSASMPQNA